MKPYFKHFDISGVRLPYITPLMGGAQQCCGGYTYGPVMRRYYIIEYVLGGRGEYIVNGTSYKAEQGQAFIIKPYEAHLLRADVAYPWEYVWIGFSTDLELPRVMADNYVFDGAPARDIFLSLTDGTERSASDYAAAIFSVFSRYYAMQTESEESPADPIERAVAIIRKEYATVRVEELAERLYMNRSYFGARFKEKTGCSPKQFIDDTRLSAAAMMMTELGYTATQAALACGYSDAMSFSRMYKKHFGKPPRASIVKRSERGGTIILK